MPSFIRAVVRLFARRTELQHREPVGPIRNGMQLPMDARNSWLQPLSQLLNQHANARQHLSALSAVESMLKMTAGNRALDHLPAPLLGRAARQLADICDLQESPPLAELASRMRYLEWQGRQRPQRSAESEPSSAGASQRDELPGLSLFLEDDAADTPDGFARTDFASTDFMERPA